jgi:hypothetical protein
MGYRQSIESLQWLAYIGRTKDNLIHPGKGVEVRLPGLPNLKFDGFGLRLMKSLSIFGVFCTVVRPVCPNGTSPSTIPMKLWRTDMIARLQKIGDAGYVVSIWGLSLETYYYKIQA